MEESLSCKITILRKDRRFPGKGMLQQVIHSYRKVPKYDEFYKPVIP